MRVSQGASSILFYYYTEDLKHYNNSKLCKSRIWSVLLLSGKFKTSFQKGTNSVNQWLIYKNRPRSRPFNLNLSRDCNPGNQTRKNKNLQ